MFCIYRITNKINGNTYIGQHKYIDQSNPMGKYKGSGKILWLAYKKYGFDNFETEILYSRIRDKSTVDAMEIWAIEKYRPEYSIAKGGTGGITYKGSCPLKGRKPSDETRAKMRAHSHHDSHHHELNVYQWNAWVKYWECIYHYNSHEYYKWKHHKRSLSRTFDKWVNFNISIIKYNNWKLNPPSCKFKGRISPTKGMHWYKSPDEKQYGLFRVCPDGWIKTTPREVNKSLRMGK